MFAYKAIQMLPVHVITDNGVVGIVITSLSAFI